MDCLTTCGILKNKVKHLLILLLLASLNTMATNFYIGGEVPQFSKEEQEILAAFNIQFLRLENVRQIDRHNKEVKELIEANGTFWRDTLIQRSEHFSESNKRFLKYLFGPQSVDHFSKRKNSKISRSISYHINGMIAVYKVKTPLRKNGGGFFHYRIETKNWNKKGQRIKGTRKEFYGSAC